MENFDFNRLASLAKTPDEFEKERSRLIDDALSKIPEPQREKCIALQKDIDEARARLSSEQFMAFLMMKLQENLADMNDQFASIQALVEKDSPNKPRLEAINKIAYISNKG